jgi:hypothetical protein
LSGGLAQLKNELLVYIRKHQIRRKMERLAELRS